MRWLVAGASGMLGTDLVAVLRDRGVEVTATRRCDLDITDHTAALDAIAGHDVVVNCAAWTDVDSAEAHESDAFAVNATGAHVLARSAAQQGARMVHVSTDYVFDGRATSPYREDGLMAPQTAYGRTKAAGEWAVLAASPANLVVRTAWLYGEHGPCFPKTIARIARERPTIDVVDDQVGQPTWTMDLARLVLSLIESGAPGGTYHGTSAGAGTWFDFARHVVESAGISADVVRPTTSAASPRPARRPAYSALGHDALHRVGVEPIGSWDSRWRVAADSVLA